MSSRLMDIGRSGMVASQRQLATTSHNIANANTEGYSRQRVELETANPVGEGSYYIGRGVNISEVRRIHDDNLERRLRSSTSENEFNSERTYYLRQIENLFNESNGEGLNKILNNFFNSFRELSNQPENDTIRSIVRNNAELVVKDFHRISSRIEEIREGMDRKIAASVADINDLSQRIAELNIKIAKIELTGTHSGDLRDKRDLAVKELSKFFKTHTYENEKGQYVVSAIGVGSLVTAAMHTPLNVEMLRHKMDDFTRDSTEIYFSGYKSHLISENFQQGKLEALFTTRDEDLKELKDHVDNIAFNLSNAVNAIHKRGYINKPLQVDQQGNPVPSFEHPQITDIDFFEEMYDSEDAARLINLNSLISEDADYIASALNANSPSDNRVALAITKLQSEKFLNDGTATIEEEYLKSIGKIGISTSKSNMKMEHTKGILAQLQNLRESYSGVSIDEEAANMVQYQQAYQAAARVIKTSEEMFDTIWAMMNT